MPVRLHGTDKAEIKQIADYLKSIEEGLDEQGCRELTDLGHVTKLHLIIKRFMDAAFQTTDKKLKPLLVEMSRLSLRIS